MVYTVIVVRHLLFCNEQREPGWGFLCLSGRGGELWLPKGIFREEKDDENRDPALLCPTHLPASRDRL